jgi:hypothetical protein
MSGRRCSLAARRRGSASDAGFGTSGYETATRSRSGSCEQLVIAGRREGGVQSAVHWIDPNRVHSARHSTDRVNPHHVPKSRSRRKAPAMQQRPSREPQANPPRRPQPRFAHRTLPNPHARATRCRVSMWSWRVATNSLLARRKRWPQSRNGSGRGSRTSARGRSASRPVSGGSSRQQKLAAQLSDVEAKVGRNERSPCGLGLKYKTAMAARLVARHAARERPARASRRFSRCLLDDVNGELGVIMGSVEVSSAAEPELCCTFG